MQNVEFKAELRDLEAARGQCRMLEARRIAVVKQNDTYYRVSDGRLKHRVSPGQPPDWVLYHRADRLQPTVSTFTILTEQQARKRWGTHSLRPWVTVHKLREIWMLANRRIHLDVVEDLGTFIEFEGIVSKSQTADQCEDAVNLLRLQFQPVLGEPIAESYCDLMVRHLEQEALLESGAPSE